MSWVNYKDKVKRYFPFSRSELQSFLLLVVVFAFMWSFTTWGTTTFDVKEGLKNLLMALVAVGVVVFVHHAAQRLVGLWYGYRIEHKVWWAGLLTGLLALVLSNGRLLLFAASSMQAHFLAAHRIGAFRYGPGLRQIGAAALAGPTVSVAVAFLLYLVSPAVFTDMLSFSLFFAAYNMLPIPPLDGLQVFVGARMSSGGSFTYMFTVSAFLGFFLLYFLTGIGFWWSLLLALLVGVVGWLVFYILVEQ